MTSGSDEALLAANQAFYDAHEARDIEAMAAVWGRGDDIVCVHPGWPILLGWADTRRSWEAIFSGPGRSQFILTEVRAVVDGGAGWVTLNENLVDHGTTSTIAATNIFRLGEDERWHLVVHHGSPVMAR